MTKRSKKQIFNSTLPADTPPPSPAPMTEREHDKWRECLGADVVAELDARIEASTGSDGAPMGLIDQKHLLYVEARRMHHYGNIPRNLSREHSRILADHETLHAESNRESDAMRPVVEKAKEVHARQSESGKIHGRGPGKNAEGETIADYKDRFIHWHKARKTMKGAAEGVAGESGFKCDAIRKHAERHNWIE